MSDTSTLSVMGVDFGTRKIGLAVGQTLTRTAMGIGVVPVKEHQPDWQLFDDMVKRWKPGAFVVGLPYNMDDTENEMTKAATRFARTLTKRYNLPCHFTDERLSTREAREISRNNSALRGKRHNDRANVDAMAAQLLLETWLNGE